MRKHEVIENELKRNLEYLEEFKQELEKLLNENITDFQEWAELIGNKTQDIQEIAHKIDTLKFVLK